MIRNTFLRTMTRASLVVLFPFSATDEILHWGRALKQAKSGPAPVAQAAPELLIAGIAIEAITPICIMTSRWDREAAALLAGFCASTALLYHPLWTYDDLFAKEKSAGREEPWEFLKNFGLVGPTVVALDDNRRSASPPRQLADGAVGTGRRA